MTSSMFAYAMAASVLVASLCTAPAHAEWITRSVTLGSLPRAIALDPVTNKVYVAQEDGATVYVFEPLTGAGHSIAVQSAPNALAINVATRRLYVANQQSHSVSVVDVTTDAVLATVQVGSNPYSLAVNPVTNRIFVTNAVDGTVSVIDGATNQVVHTSTAGGSPQAVAINPLNNKVYVVNHNSASVSVIDGSSYAVTPVSVGSTPNAVCVNPTTGYVYVANSASNNVTRIDGTTNATTTIGASTQPYSIAADPVSNKIYCCNVAANSVTIIDGATNTGVTRTVGTAPVSVVVNSATRRAYVCNLNGTTLSIIDGGTNTVTQNLTIGSRGLCAAVNPWTQRVFVALNVSSGTGLVEIDGTQYTAVSVTAGNAQSAALVHRRLHKGYVLNSGSASVTELDLSTSTVSATVAVGTTPIAGVVDELRNRIYVANAGSGTVSVIDAVTHAVTTVTVGSNPRAIALAPRANRVFVANAGSASVTVIDGATLTPLTLAVGDRPAALAVQPGSEACYVANRGANTVTRLDGYGVVTHTRCVGVSPASVAADPVTNRVFVANSGDNSVTVLEGDADRPRRVAVGTHPVAVVVDAVLGRAFTADSSGNTVTVIKEADFTTSTITVGTRPVSLSLNTWMRRLYVNCMGSTTSYLVDLNTLGSTTQLFSTAVNGGASDDMLGRAIFSTVSGTSALVLSETPHVTQPVNVTLDALGSDTAPLSGLTVTGTATSTRASAGITGVYVVLDTPARPWTAGTLISGAGTTSTTWTAGSGAIGALGTHVLGAAAIDVTSGTLDNSSLLGAMAFIGAPSITFFRTAPATLAVAIPSANDLWNADDLATIRVGWGPVPVNAATVDLEYQPQTGAAWISLATGLPASNGVWACNTPMQRVDSTSPLVRVRVYDGSHTEIDNHTSAMFALGHTGYVRLRAQTGPSTFTQAPVVFWNWCSDVDHFSVTLVTTSATTCKFSNATIAIVPSYRRWAQIDDAAWASLPAGRYDVYVNAFPVGGGLSTQWIAMSFVKFQLQDQDPNDNQSKAPTILVHGWTSNSDTWFACGASPLIQGLIHGPDLSQSFHPWTFEYPNVDEIRYSAAGLSAAVEYVRQASGGQGVRLIAHSMGGLVCRTYLQGQAVDPKYDPAITPLLPAPSQDRITHLVTLSSPHLGVKKSAVDLSVDVYKQFVCDGVVDSRSVDDLKDTSPLIAALDDATHPLPAIYYLMASGTDPFPETLGGSRNWWLTSSCVNGSDATVDVCSARGECTPNTHPSNSLTFSDPSKVVRGNYSLSHNRMSRPGIIVDCSKNNDSYDVQATLDSKRLLDDVLGFLRCGTCLVSSTCPGEPAKPVEISITEGGSTGFAAPVLSAQRTTAGVPIVGALVRLRPLASTDTTAGFVGSCDTDGRAVTSLNAGTYVLDVLATGHVARTETLVVASTCHDVQVGLDLPSITNYAGPTAPQIALQGGATTTVDSVVVLQLACTNATQYQLSADPGFAGDSWLPLTATARDTLRYGPGHYLLYARYADAQGRATMPISLRLEYLDASSATVLVSASGAVARVAVDDRLVGANTPTLVGSLAPGGHQVTVTADGYITQPASQSVFLNAGGSANTAFTLVASAPPAAAQWRMPANGAALSTAGMLGWFAGSDPDSGDIVTRGVAFYRDSAQTQLDWVVSGITDTSLVLPTALRDSTTYFATVKATDSHHTAQVAAPAVSHFAVDRTAPGGHIMYPAAGSTVLGPPPPPLVLAVRDWGGVATATVLLSLDGGTTYPDTLYQGAYHDSLAWNAPPVQSTQCRIRVLARDAAGNVGLVESDSLFTLKGDVLEVEHAAPPAALALRVGPAPARGPVRVAFDVPSETLVHLEVFDVAGRAVRLLASGRYPPGTYTMTWDLKSAQGQELGAGVYFLRMQAGEREKLSRVVVVR